MRATFTGAKCRFVSKAKVERAAINIALVVTAPRRKIRLFTDYADYADLLFCAICVICGNGFLPGMARTDGGDVDTGALQWAGLGVRAEV